MTKSVDHTPTHPQLDKSHDINAHDIQFHYPTPTNDMYSASMRRLSLELNHSPSPTDYPQQPQVFKTPPPTPTITTTPPPTTTTKTKN